MGKVHEQWFHFLKYRTKIKRTLWDLTTFKTVNHMKRRDAYIHKQYGNPTLFGKMPIFLWQYRRHSIVTLYSCGLCHLVSSNKAISFVQERKLANCGRWKNHHHIFTKFSLFPTYPRTLSGRATHTKQSGGPLEPGAGGRLPTIFADTLTLFQTGGRLCPPYKYLPPGFSYLPTALNSQEPAVRPPSKIVGQTMPNPLRILSEKGSCLFIRQIQLKRCQRGKIRKICTIAGKGYIISLVEFEFNSDRVYLIMTSDFIIGPK